MKVQTSFIFMFSSTFQLALIKKNLGRAKKCTKI